MPKCRTLFAHRLAESNLFSLQKLAASAFGRDDYRIEPIDSLEAVPDRGGDHLLILFQPTSSEAQAAVEAKDSEGLPSWGVVSFGSTLGLSSVITLPDFDQITAAHATILRLASENHALHRAYERTRGDLLSISTRICHDLRSPLNTIQTALYLLERPGFSDETNSTDLVQPVKDAIRGQIKLISNLCAVTEASGASDLELETINLEFAFTSAHDRIRQFLENEGVTVDVPEEWPMIVGVQAWIELSLELLLETLARGSNPPGRCIAIRFVEPRDHDWVRLSASLTNASERALPASFETQPFNRLHEEKNSRELGLPFLRRLLAVQGGRVELPEGDQTSTAVLHLLRAKK